MVNFELGSYKFGGLQKPDMLNEHNIHISKNAFNYRYKIQLSHLFHKEDLQEIRLGKLRVAPG